MTAPKIFTPSSGECVLWPIFAPPRVITRTEPIEIIPSYFSFETMSNVFSGLIYTRKPILYT